MSKLYDDMYSMNGENIDEIVENNSKLVYWTVHRFYPTFANDDDVIQMGFIGLWVAAQYYKTERDDRCHWNTYAIKAIRSRIQKYFEHQQAQHTLFSERPLSLDQMYSDDGKGCKRDALVEYAFSTADIDWVDFKSFWDSLDEMNPHAKKIVLMRYYGYSNAEIGKRLGITRERVRQILDRIRKNFDIYV